MSECARFEELRGDPCDDLNCQACCDHGDTDAYSCLDCGKELTADRMADAYDRAKDARFG